MEESLCNKTFKSRCITYAGALRLSFPLMFTLFGISKGIRHYNTRKKEKMQGMNPIFLSGLRRHFEERNNGFTLFLQNFINKKKETQDKPQILHEEENILNFDISIYIQQDISYTAIPGALTRFLNNEAHLAFSERSEKVILIQSSFRGLLSRKKLMLMNQDRIKAKALSCIILLQKHFRRIRIEKLVKEFVLVRNVLLTRKACQKKIESFIRKINTRNSIRKFELFQTIISTRHHAIISIQAKFRGYSVRKDIEKILELEYNYYTMIYPFVARSVKLKIFVYTGGSLKDDEFKIIEKLFLFQYCKLRETFVLYISPNEFKPGKYRCQLIVDNLVTCDGRFPHIEFSDGHFYNLIDFKLKRRPYSEHYEPTGPASDSEVSSFTDKSYICGLKNLHSEEPYEDLKNNLAYQEAFSHMERLKESSITDFINFD